MRYQVDPTKIDLKDRKRMVFKDFMGVDALSPVFSISNKRASKMCNLISRDGSNHKRYGWEQYLQFDGAINGVFRFTIHNTKFSVVYAGTTFWIKRVDVDEKYSRMQVCTAWIDYNFTSTSFINRECKCYIQNDKAYFIGMGDFAVFTWDSSTNKYRFASVYIDKDTYAPTTTTNISCQETDYDSNSNRIIYGERQTMEDVNLLTPRRINTIIGSQVGGAAGNPRTYKLDIAEGETIYADSNIPVYIEGYDYNSSLGLKTNFALRSSTTRDAFAPLDVDDFLSLEDLGGSVYMLIGEYMPLPSGWGKANKVTIAEGKQIENGVIKYGYEIYYYMIREDTSGILHYNKYGYVGVRVYNNLNSSEYEKDDYLVAMKLDVSGTGAGNIERLQCNSLLHILFNRAYEIDIEDVFEEAEITGYNPQTLKLTSIVNETSGSDVYKYLYYNTPAISLVSATDNTDTHVYGYIYTNTGVLQLGTNLRSFYARSIAGEANVSVSIIVMPSDYEAAQANLNKILRSSLSEVFGIGGNAQALFVSGYEPMPHMDWWSKELDYTYFPSGNECAMGTPNTKVMGYQVLGDSSLAIFKEYSTQEPSVYIRSGTDTNLIQGDDGTLSIQTGGYFTSGKYMSKGVIASKSIAVLQSDPMVLTQDGVCALTIDANTSSISNRVFRERSRLIDNIINNHAGREDAVAYVHNGKYYLCIGSDVYVADSRYTFSIKGDMTDTYNYEWWIWDNCPMHYIFENEDGELCFGTTDGRICKFYKGFEDMKKEIAEIDSLTMANNSPLVSVIDNATDILEDGEEYYFKTDTPLYAKLSFSFVSNPSASYYDGKIVRKVVNGEVDEDNEYQLSITWQDSGLWLIKLINTDTLVETIYNQSQDIVVMDISNLRFKAYKPIALGSGSSLIDSKLYDAANSAEELINYRYAGFYNYTISADRKIELVHVQAQNVAAYWYSPALDFGTNDYEKVMLYVTIATERHTNGQVIFGWETREIEAEITSKGMDTFDFEEVNFNRIALDTTWNTSYTRNLKCNFNFIMFRFESDNDVDCCVHQFTIGYKINHKNRGVR